MNLPTDFKNRIAETFYDKEFTLMTPSESVDDEGFVTQEVEESDTTYMGNVRYDSMDKIMQDYGLSDKIDMTITTESEVPAGSIIQYDSKEYRVIRCVEFDSHYLLLTQLWLQKSSTLISV